MITPDHRQAHPSTGDGIDEDEGDTGRHGELLGRAGVGDRGRPQPGLLRGSSGGGGGTQSASGVAGSCCGGGSPGVGVLGVGGGGGGAASCAQGGGGLLGRRRRLRWGL